MYKKISVILLSIVLAYIIAACSPKESASDIVNKYFSYISNQQYKEAYSLLDSDSKKNIPLEQFKEFQDLHKSYINTKEVNIGEEKNKNDKHITVPVNRKLTYIYDQEKVIRNNNWDILLTLEKQNYRVKWKNFYKDLSDLYVSTAWEEFYRKDGSFNKAAMLAKKAVNENNKNPEAYYVQSYIYSELERYEESLDSINKCIDLSKNKELLSEAYNSKGCSLVELNRLEEATESYNKAIEINQDNEFAKTNLQILENNTDDISIKTSISIKNSISIE